MKFTTVIKYFCSIPKTVYFNFKVFDFKKAIKFPIVVNYNVELGCLYKGCIVIEDDVKTAMILLGCSGGSPGVFIGETPRIKCGGYISIQPRSKIVFHGKARFEKGFSLKVDKGGIIELGRNFSANSYFFASSNELIKIGDDVVIGWEVSIRDVDGHIIYKEDDLNQVQINKNKPVYIGNHVWIAAKVDILKGTVISDDTVIAYGTLLTGNKFQNKKCIIGGSPARILKQNVDWKK